MTPPHWCEEVVSRTHDRNAFDCGDDDLNTFLRRYARQSHEVGGAKTFLAIAEADRRVLGFYSLAPASVSHNRAPESVRRRLPHHDIPGFRLARLAVARDVQGMGLGTQLLLSAGKRCLRAATEVGGVILVIDAKNDLAANWYETLGAVRLADEPQTLVLPLATITAALKSAGKW